ncbi:MAG: hypothetical protein SO119_08140 [Phascolarctobacterium sp.]|nr:hypothetical protein [Phascolarctobacterium sp.]
MKSKKTLALILALVALAAAAAFYFLYFIRTPAYALNQARLAVKEHDTVKFERYVDVQSVMDNAFEDIIKAESKINNDNVFSNPFALGILHMLKPSVVDLMKQEALERVANKPAQQDKAVDPVPDAMKRNMERHIPLDQLKFKDIKLTKHEGGKAIATLVLANESLNKDFIASLQLELNAQDDWQIKKVANLSDLIIQLSAARKAKLAAANKPIMERLNKAVQASEARLNLFTDSNTQNGEDPEQVLTATLTMKNMTGVTINRMYYDVTIMDEAGKEVYSYPEHFRGAIAPGQTVAVNTSKHLHAMLPDDKKLMGMDLAKMSGKIQITYIAFDDGNVLSPNTFME